MSKYHANLDYVIPVIDISPEELREIAAEAEAIIAENKGSPRELAEAYLKKGRCLQKIEECRGSQETDKAKQDKIKVLIEKALELSPDMPEALMQMGKIFAVLGDNEKAIELYSKAILLKKDYAAAYNNRGNCYSKLKEYEKAAEDYSEAIQIRPDDATYYHNLGLCYRELGEYEKAVANYSEAIRIRPDYAVCYNNRGDCYFELEEYEKAIADYSEAIRIQPDDADYYNNRGICYSKLKEQGKAIADYSEAIRIRADDPNYYNNRGNCYSELGEQEKAIADYSEAIRIRPNFAACYNNRGGTYFKLTDHEKAIVDFTSAIRYGSEAFIRQKKLFILRGREYRAIKEYGKAAADFSESLRLSPDKREALVLKWQVYLEADGSDQAAAGIIKPAKERIIKALNLKSLEVKIKQDNLYTEFIFNSGFRGILEMLPDEIDEAMITHVRKILDMLNALDTSTQKEFREKWETTTGDTDWDQFSSYVNLNDISLGEIVFYKDYTFQLAYPVPGAGEKIGKNETDNYVIMARFGKDLKPDYIFFEKNPFGGTSNEKNYPLALNGFGGKEAYIAEIAESVYEFLIEQPTVEEEVLVEEKIVVEHFPQFRKIEILVALEILAHDNKIRKRPSFAGVIGNELEEHRYYASYSPITARGIAREKADERLDRILSVHGLERRIWHWDSDIATGIAIRKEVEGEICFKFELRSDELTKLEKVEGTFYKICAGFLVDSSMEIPP